MPELFKQTFQIQATGEKKKNSHANNLAYDTKQNLMKNHQTWFQYKLKSCKNCFANIFLVLTLVGYVATVIFYNLLLAQLHGLLM